MVCYLLFNLIRMAVCNLKTGLKVTMVASILITVKVTFWKQSHKIKTEGIKLFLIDLLLGTYEVFNQVIK